MSLSPEDYKSSTIFVGNLPFKTTDEQLRDMFSEAGYIRDCHIMTKGQLSLGYGYVTFMDDLTADRAIDMLNKKKVHKHKINVYMAHTIPEDYIHRSTDVSQQYKHTTAYERKHRRDSKSSEDNAETEEHEHLAAIQKLPHKVLVENLPFTITSDRLRLMFAHVGDVVDTHVAMKRSRSLGYGYVAFNDEASVLRAVDMMEGKEVGGRSLNVYVARPHVSRRSTSHSLFGLPGIKMHRRESHKEETEAHHHHEASHQSDFADKYHHSIYVGNLPPHVTDSRLRHFFSQIGFVKDAHVEMKDGESLGYGYVAFSNSDTAHRAIETLDQLDIDGRKINIYMLSPEHEKHVRHKFLGLHIGGRHRRSSTGGIEEYEHTPPAPIESMKHRVYVGNLPFETTDEQLRSMFAEVGPVRNASIMIKRSRSRGFGYVAFDDDATAQKAVDLMDRKMVNGRPINVDMGLPMSKSHTMEEIVHYPLPEDKPGDKVEDKPEHKAEDKPEHKAEDKPEHKAEGKLRRDSKGGGDEVELHRNVHSAHAVES
ncbi:hypothetical protein GGI12_002380 [Dipsacomyces acuminosporus]|nr:hypothetical protein GGI12_002380 [Dipsacomyces acuminosporus]